MAMPMCISTVFVCERNNEVVHQVEMHPQIFAAFWLRQLTVHVAY